MEPVSTAGGSDNRLHCQVVEKVVEKVVYVDMPVEKVFLPRSASAIVLCSHGMSRPSPRAGIRRLACGCSSCRLARRFRCCRSRRVRDYQVVEKVFEKVVYVDRPLEKVPGRPLRHRHALHLFLWVGGHACHRAATGMLQITQTRTSARAREHLHRVGKQTCFVPPLADPRDVSFPGAPGQVAGGVGGIALGDEVCVFPCYESSAAAAGMLLAARAAF